MSRIRSVLGTCSLALILASCQGSAPTNQSSTQPGSASPQPGSASPQPGSASPQPGSASPQPGSAGVVYYLTPNLMDEWQAGSKLLAEQDAASLGYKLVTLNAGNQAATQANQFDAAISQHPKAIITAGVDSSTIGVSIDKARAAGIPVFVYDREVTITPVDFTSEMGITKIGLIGADETAKVLTAKYGTARGTVLEIMGDSGDSYTVGIDQGFRAQMTKNYPEVKVIVKDTPGWTPEAAASDVDDQLTANKNIDVIFVHSDARAPAIVAVLQAHNLKKGDVTLIGTDGTPTGLTAIRDGWMLETVQTPIPVEMYGIWQFMGDVLAKKQIAAGSVDVQGTTSELTIEKWGLTLRVPGTIVDAKNVDDPTLWGNLKVVIQP